MNLSPLPIQKFFDNDGNPLVGGLLFTYRAGTSTKVATYIDSTGVTPNTNPIVLDFRGECRLWIDPQQSYKFVLSPRGDTDPPTKPIWTVDNITVSPLPSDNAAVDTGSVNNISLSIAQITSPVAFTRIVFKVAFTNTGPTTISINGGTAIALTLQSTGAFGGHEVFGGGIYEAIFDGARWQLQGPAIAYWRTDREIAVGIVPVNSTFPAGNVHRYGAVGNGVADDTAAIQTAYLAVGSGGIIEFDALTYNFTLLRFDGLLDNIFRGRSGGNLGNTAVGSFAGATVLRSTQSAVNAIEFAGTGYNSKELIFEDILFHAATTGYVISFNNCSQISFNRCTVVNDGGNSESNGVQFSKCFYVFGNELFVLKGLNQRIGLSKGVTINMGANTAFLGGLYNFKNSSFQAFQTGVHVGDPNPSAQNENYANVNLVNCEMLANQVGAAFQHGTKNAMLEGCYIEANTDKGVNVTLAATGVSLRNCFFNNYSAGDCDLRFGTGGGNTQYQQFLNCSVEGCIFLAVNIVGIAVSAIAGSFVNVKNCNLTLGTGGAIGISCNLATACRVDDCTFNGFAGNNTSGSFSPSLNTTGGTFVATITGMTAVVTGTAYYYTIGNMVTLFLPTLSGTSNAGTCTITGLPSAAIPVRDQGIQRVYSVNNSVANSTGIIQLASTGIFNAYPSDAFGAWTAANGKSIGAFNYTYLLT